MQGPPAGSFHHKQLWAERVSVPPLLVPLPPGGSPHVLGKPQGAQRWSGRWTASSLGLGSGTTQDPRG